VLSAASALVALHADGKMSELADERAATGITSGQLAEYEGYSDRRDSFRTGAYVLGGAAIAGGLAALGMYWFDDRSPAQRELAPMATSDGAGVMLTRKF